MAKVKLNPLVKDIRGKLGGYVFRRTHMGETILSKSPDMSQVAWSETQQTHRQRFKAAVAYAKAAMADPQVSLTYQQAALQQGKRPFDLAISYYFKGKDLLTNKAQ